MKQIRTPLDVYEDDKLFLGDPLNGLTFPAPNDIREILHQRIQEIICVYENTINTEYCVSYRQQLRSKI